MFISNYHTHTSLCKHASGMPLEYFEQAKKDGCNALGFSDHCPYPIEYKNIWPHCRMSECDVQNYKNCVLEVKNISDFPVYFGFECEWDKDFKNWYETQLKGIYQAEYLVFGPHWVVVGKEHIYIKDCASDDAMLNKYVNQTIEGMASGLYSFVAHPDLFMAGRQEWDSQAYDCSKAIICAAIDLDLPLEVNGYGIVKSPIQTSKGERFQYPVKEFWELAKTLGARVICNSDSHTPSDVVKNALKARNFAQNLGISVVEKLNFCDKKL